MAKKPMLNLWKNPRSEDLWFRRRVPEPLVAFMGRREVKFSLGTPDPAVARIRCLEEGLKLDKVWHQRLGEMPDVPTAGAPVVPLGIMAASATNRAMPATSATSCKAVTSCREAVILWCGGYSRAAADGDGIPCENFCRSLSQVEPFKKEIGCNR